MKKIYNSPSMEVIQIATQQMLAASYNGTPVDAGKTEGRGYSFDDDWEDEEDW